MSRNNALAEQERADRDREAGNYSAADQHYSKAKLMWKDLGDEFGAAYCVYGRGLCAKEEGDHAAALAQFNHALGFFDSIAADDKRYDEAMKMSEMLRQTMPQIQEINKVPPRHPPTRSHSPPPNYAHFDNIDKEERRASESSTSLAWKVMSGVIGALVAVLSAFWIGHELGRSKLANATQNESTLGTDSEAPVTRDTDLGHLDTSKIETLESALSTLQDEYDQLQKLINHFKMAGATDNPHRINSIGVVDFELYSCLQVKSEQITCLLDVRSSVDTLVVIHPSNALLFDEDLNDYNMKSFTADGRPLGNAPESIALLGEVPVNLLIGFDPRGLRIKARSVGLFVQDGGRKTGFELYLRDPQWEISQSD